MMNEKHYTSIKVSLPTRNRLAQMKYSLKIKDYDTLLIRLLRVFDPKELKKEVEKDEGISS